MPYSAVPASSQSKKSHTQQHTAVIKDNQQWLAIVRLSAIGELVPAPITEGQPWSALSKLESVAKSGTVALYLSYRMLKRIVDELYKVTQTACSVARCWSPSESKWLGVCLLFPPVSPHVPASQGTCHLSFPKEATVYYGVQYTWKWFGGAHKVPPGTITAKMARCAWVDP